MSLFRSVAFSICRSFERLPFQRLKIVYTVQLLRTTDITLHVLNNLID